MVIENYENIKKDELRHELEESYRFPFGEKMLISKYVKKYAEDPDRTALIFYGRRITFRELDDWSDRFAAALHDLGYKNGDRMAMFLQNGPQAYIGFLAAEKLGIIRVTVDPMHKESELKHQVDDSGAVLIFVQDQMYPIVEKIRSNSIIKHVIVTSFHDFLPEQPEIPLHSMMKPEKQVFPDTFEFLDLLEQYEPRPPYVDISLYDFGWLLYTGGTTGLPKGCIHTNYNAVASAVGGGYSYGGIINSFKYYRPELIAAFPVTHISGLLIFCFLSVWGGCGIMLARMDPMQILEAIDRYKPSTLIAPLLIFHAIIENYPKVSQKKHYDLTSLTSCLCSSHGGAWNKEHGKKWFDLTGTYLYSWGYSGTEYFNYPAAGAFLNRLEDMAYGKPGPGFRVRIEDLETRAVLPHGERGEIVAKCATLFEGYWNNREKTEDTLVNGWFRSGDMGSLGKDETLYFFGKATEAFPVSGYMVSPDEIATIGLNHPDIAEIAVISVPNPERQNDNVPKAFVVLHQQSSATEEELIAWFKKNISHYKCPRRIEIRTSLPKSVKGEILKRELIKQEAAGRKP